MCFGSRRLFDGWSGGFGEAGDGRWEMGDSFSLKKLNYFDVGKLYFLFSIFSINKFFSK